MKVFRATNAEASPCATRLDPREQYRITMEIERSGWELGVDLPLAHEEPRPIRRRPTSTSPLLARRRLLIVSLEIPTTPEREGVPDRGPSRSRRSPLSIESRT